MLTIVERWLKRIAVLVVMLAALCAAWFGVFAWSDIKIAAPLQFTLKQGSSLRSATRQMQAAGVIQSPLQFELLARLYGAAGRIQAGNYEIEGSLTPLELLAKITSGERGQDQVTLIEGWTFAQIRALLDAHPALKHDTRGVADSEIAARLGISEASPEGWLLPDTYYFVNGTSDIAVLLRAHRALQVQLDQLWNARAEGLPYENPYQALILASLVEKETGRPSERPMIAAVFVNRLKRGMLLQTDPSVIYGLGVAFDGNLRKRDLLADGPYNTYTRVGLPPTPIAMPGLAALTAALNPAPSDALYFVARGDGTSQFSASLAEHERAVTKYQRRAKR